MDYRVFTNPKIIHPALYILKILFMVLAVYTFIYWYNHHKTVDFWLSLYFLHYSIRFDQLRICYDRVLVEEYNQALELKNRLFNRRKRRKLGITREK